MHKKIDRKINEKQIKFCERYLANGRNSSEAATYAGYKYKNISHHAYKILDMANVKDYLEKRMKEVNEELKIDLNYKIKKLKKIIDAGIPDNMQYIYEADVSAIKLALEAIAEANKMTGDYAPTKQANLNCNMDIDNVIITVAREAIKDY